MMGMTSVTGALQWSRRFPHRRRERVSTVELVLGDMGRSVVRLAVGTSLRTADGGFSLHNVGTMCARPSIAARRTMIELLHTRALLPGRRGIDRGSADRQSEVASQGTENERSASSRCVACIEVQHACRPAHQAARGLDGPLIAPESDHTDQLCSACDNLDQLCELPANVDL